MTVDEIKKKFEECDGIWGFLNGIQPWSKDPKGEWHCDPIIYISSDDLKIARPYSGESQNDDVLYYRMGSFVDGFRTWRFRDYGKTWAFTEEELADPPMPTVDEEVVRRMFYKLKYLDWVVGLIPLDSMTAQFKYYFDQLDQEALLSLENNIDSIMTYIQYPYKDWINKNKGAIDATYRFS